MNLRRLAPIALLATLALAGCSAPAEEAPAAPAATTTAPTPADDAPSDGAAGATADTIRAQLPEELAALVDSVTEGGGRLGFATSIENPRSAAGSPEAQSAIDLCEAAVALGDHEMVYVSDSRGSIFVSYGDPQVSEDACTEVRR